MPAPSQLQPSIQMDALNIPHWGDGLSRMFGRPSTAPAVAPLHIPHWSEVMATVYDNNPQAATTPWRRNIAQDKKLWMQSYLQFVAYWATRKTDTIAADHPLQQWVSRQRKHYRLGKLRSWKYALLEQAGFQFVAARIAATPDDMAYARLLLAFHAEHGHCAPTNTIGGAGLTRWVRRMRQSGGTRGMASGTADTANQALKFLQQHLKEFDMEQTHKRDYNLAHGRTFNGFIPHQRTPMTPLYVESLRALHTSEPVVASRYTPIQGTWAQKMAHRINYKVLQAQQRGYVVLVYGEESLPQRFASARANVHDDCLEIRYYGSRAAAGKTFATQFSQSDAQSISFRGNVMTGIDEDGEPMCIDFAAFDKGMRGPARHALQWDVRWDD